MVLAEITECSAPETAWGGDLVTIRATIINIEETGDIWVRIIDYDTKELLAIPDELVIVPGFPFEARWDFTMPGKTWNLEVQAGHWEAGVIVGVDSRCRATIMLAVPPLKGYLDVHAYANDTEVSASVEVAGVGTYTTPFLLETDPGAYTLNATYNDQAETKTAPVTEGQTTNVTFAFVTPPAPPPAPPPLPPIFPSLREKLYPIIPGLFDKFDELRGKLWGT